MNDSIIEKNLKERLILSGLKELEEHGVKDFSLRRVASLAEVSCAAPYRHFKNKEELISAIINYIKDDWLLLSNQICEVFLGDYPSLIKELCSASIKFWIANGNFLSVLFLIQSSTKKEQKESLSQFDIPLLNAIKKYANQQKFSDIKLANLQTAIPSLIYGAITLITRGTKTTEQVIEDTKNIIDILIS